MTVSHVYQKFWLLRYLTARETCPLSITPAKASIASSSHPPTSLERTYIQVFLGVMEYHAVPPEERARDEDGNLLPWGYVYKE